ncbi:MAG: OsmC family peroxiredoxin [Balneolaceae bacterium]|nr:MAG: OsmC family peroxiredoxin [Balneolaceae bacterium]
MPKRKASAEWKGTLPDGNGSVSLGSGAFEGAYSFSSRFEEGVGTNPEELIGAAHAGCFSMALSAELGKSGFKPQSVKTEAVVHLVKEDAGFTITEIDLDCDAHVPGIDEDEFSKFAEGAKKNCPVSKVLAGAKINLTARLKN